MNIHIWYIWVSAAGETWESGTHYWNDQCCVFIYIHVYKYIYTHTYVYSHTHTYFPLVDFNPDQLERRNSIGPPVVSVGAVST